LIVRILLEKIRATLNRHERNSMENKVFHWANRCLLHWEKQPMNLEMNKKDAEVGRLFEAVARVVGAEVDSVAIYTNCTWDGKTRTMGGSATTSRNEKGQVRIIPFMVDLPLDTPELPNQR